MAALVVGTSGANILIISLSFPNRISKTELAFRIAIPKKIQQIALTSLNIQKKKTEVKAITIFIIKPKSNIETPPIFFFSLANLQKNGFRNFACSNIFS